jgi:hypothetical protein
MQPKNDLIEEYYLLCIQFGIEPFEFTVENTVIETIKAHIESNNEFIQKLKEVVYKYENKTRERYIELSEEYELETNDKRPSLYIGDDESVLADWYARYSKWLELKLQTFRKH